MGVTIEEIRGLGGSQKSYKWKVFLPAILDPLVNSLDSFVDNRVAQSGSNLARKSSSIISGQIDKSKISLRGFNPSIQVEEIQGVPFPGVSAEPFYEAGRSVNFPGLEEIEPFSISFFQDESPNIPIYIMDWKRLIMNEDGTTNLPSNYKKPIRIQLLDGKNRPTFDYQLLGCFPTSTTPLALTNESGRLTFTQEFSVDRVEILPGSFQQLARNEVTDKLRKTTSEQINQLSNFTNKP